MRYRKQLKLPNWFIVHYLLNEHFLSIPVSEEAIRSSCYTGSLAIAEVICAKEPHAYTGGFGEKGTPISLAIQSHQPYKFLSFLLTQGADPYLSSGRFAPVLPAAVVCYRGSVAIAALVDHGIDLKYRNILLIVVRRGYRDLVRFLLHREIISPTNDQGQGDEHVDVTPVLHLAVAKGDVKMVELLLEYGVDRGE